MNFYKVICIGMISLMLSWQTHAGSSDIYLIFAAEMPEIATEYGDYAELSTLISQYRNTKTPTFFLFGGASLGPSILSVFDRGSHIIDILNTLEPDVMAVANREFSYFEDELSLRASEAAFPFVASNLWDPFTDGNLDGLVEHVIVQQGNYTLGIISVIEPYISEQYALKRVKITPPEKAAREQAAILREKGVDIIVLLYSSELPFLSSLLEDGTINISLRKDNHYLITHNEVVQTHPHDVFLPKPGLAAVISIVLPQGDNTGLTMEAETVSLAQYAKEPLVHSQIQGYTQRLDQLLNREIGLTKVAMDTRRHMIRTRENVFANFVTDTMRERTRSDIALINGGTFRGDLIYEPDSIITRRDIAREFPFRNSVVRVEVSGQKIWEALESGLSQYEMVRGRFPHVSGMQLVFDSTKPVGSRLISIDINGKPLQQGETYTLATLDYIINGGDGYTMLKIKQDLGNGYHMNWLLSDMVIASIQKAKVISPVLDSRLINLSAIPE